MNIDTFRFKSDAFQGLGETTGLARRQGSDLLLQFQTRDSLFGVLKSSVKSRLIGADQIAAIEYRGGWFGLWPRVRVSLTDLAGAEDLPGGAEGIIQLGVRWADRKAAKTLVERMQSECSERRFQALQADIEQLSQRDPRQQQATPPAAPSGPPPLATGQPGRRSESD